MHMLFSLGLTTSGNISCITSTSAHPFGFTTFSCHAKASYLPHTWLHAGPPLYHFPLSSSWCCATVFSFSFKSSLLDHTKGLSQLCPGSGESLLEQLKQLCCDMGQCWALWFCMQRLQTWSHRLPPITKILPHNLHTATSTLTLSMMKADFRLLEELLGHVSWETSFEIGSVLTVLIIF